MDSYKVISDFVDLSDNLYEYKVGDEYPRKGTSPTDKRVKELLTGDNMASKIFIKKDIKTPENKKKEISTPEKKKPEVVTPEKKKQTKQTR